MLIYYSWKVESLYLMNTLDDKKRILIADDEQLIRDVFRLILKTKLPELHLDIAVNGEEAVKLFSAHKHAAIIMDIHMPIKNGIQAYKEIRDICTDKEWKMPNFIFCTGYQPPNALKDIVNGQSPHKIIVKPVPPDTLTNAINDALA